MIEAGLGSSMNLIEPWDRYRRIMIRLLRMAEAEAEVNAEYEAGSPDEDRLISGAVYESTL